MIAEMLGITIEQLKQEVIAQWQKELKYFEFKEDYVSCIIIRDKIKLLQ